MDEMSQGVRPRYAVLALIAVALIGCSGLHLARPTAPAPTSPQITPRAKGVTAANSTPSPAKQAGQLAYIGADGNVYVTTADGESSIKVTSDATVPPEGEGLSYHRISWSPDGRLAFAAVTRSGNKARSRLYVVESPGGPARIVGRSDEHFVIYVYWSPVPCTGRPTCQRLAYLIEEEDGVGLHVVEMDAGQVENRLAGVGRPFYFSWSPDGRQIVGHTGGARRHNPDARITLYDVDRDYVEILPQAPGLFYAPAWSPQGDRWLGVVADEGMDQLQGIGPDQPTALAAALDAQIAFSWSPSGDQVAYAIRENSDDTFYGPVHLFDLNTGKSRQVTNAAFSIAAFFWAPDGQRIGYLSQLSLPDAVWMQWRVYDLARDQDRGFTAFHPTPLMRFVIHSFNQYAQSHRFWSPDGRYLVYADRDRTLVERVWLVDTWAERGADPIPVDAGSIGIWSWK